MKNGARFVAIGGAALAGALALSACATEETPSGKGAVGDCAKGTVNAAGSSAQANAISEWSKAYSQNCAGATLNYNPSGSGAGVQAFTQGQVAFAGSDSALKPEEQGPADARCKTGKAINLPLVVGPVGVVYNLQGVDGLQLSPKTIAGIFAGKIAKWDDAAIKADNPSAKLPPDAIKSVHRADDSGTTANFTKFLKANAPEIWTYEPDKKWAAPGGTGATKSDGVSTVVKQTPGAISYVELSYVTNGKLQAAKVANGAGEFVTIGADSASKTLDGAKVVGQGNDVALSIDYATKQAGAYPIVLVTYEIVCEKGLPADQAKFVKSFLTYAAGEKGQEVLSKLGYAPIPASVITKVRASVTALS